MAVMKDEWNGYKGRSWRVVCYFKDWQGIRRRHEKRGFKTKKEASAYEREFLAKCKRDINMGFGTFVDLYLNNLKPQIKASTFATKESIIDTHIRPAFENRSLSEITSTDVLQWQNKMLTQHDEQGKGYSQTYLRSVQNQLSAIFNHAVKYYGLDRNPCVANSRIGKQKGKEMLFWTKEEYTKFVDAIKDKPMSYYGFQLLYWTGIRIGELLALTKADFDLKRKVVHINKTFQVVKGVEQITSPKTVKSNRQIDLPDFLCREMEDYFASLYKISDDSRLFEVTKYYFHHEMTRGCKLANVKRIRLHDLRHSSCALLIHLGYSPVQIAERLGHESVTITERYAHLYPSVQREMANKLEAAFQGEGGER